jgi:hypothetical protein
MAVSLMLLLASQIPVTQLHPKTVTMVIAILFLSLVQLANPSAKKATPQAVRQRATLATSRVQAVSPIHAISITLPNTELAGIVGDPLLLAQPVSQHALMATFRVVLQLANSES